MTRWAILGMLIPSLVYAGGEDDARAVGMARAQVAITENTEAPLWNPAALGIASRNPGRFVVNFLSFGVRAGNNILSIPQYNKYNGTVWDESDKRKIVKLFDGEDRLSASGDGVARALSVQYRQFAFDMSFVSAGHAEVPREVADFFLTDYVVGEETISPNGKLRGDMFLSTGLSAGLSLKKWIRVPWRELAGGITLRYYRGFQHAHSKELGAHIEESDSIISHGSYDLVTAKGGNGFGADIGFLAEINEQWSVGLSAQNIISTVSWTQGAERRVGEYHVRSSGVIQLEDDWESSDSTVSTKSFSSTLPAILRLGAGYRLNSTMLFAGDVEAFLNSVSGKTTPRAAVGMEYRPQFLIAWRTGFSIGGDNRGFNWSGGVGFYTKRFRIDLATNNLEGLLTLNRFSFAFGFKGYF